MFFCRRRALDVVLPERKLQHRGDGAGLLQRHSAAEKVRGKTGDERQLAETAGGHKPDDRVDDRVHMLEQRFARVRSVFADCIYYYQ